MPSRIRFPCKGLFIGVLKGQFTRCHDGFQSRTFKHKNKYTRDMDFAERILKQLVRIIHLAYAGIVYKLLSGVCSSAINLIVMRRKCKKTGLLTSAVQF